jgi:hypothetical protein
MKKINYQTQEKILLFFFFILVFFITFQYNLYKFPDAKNGALIWFDGRRYLSPNSLKEVLNHPQFNNFSSYLFYIFAIKKLNLINYLPIIQFITFYISAYFFFRGLNIYGKNVSYLGLIFVLLNPIFFKWCHAVNPTILNIIISLFLVYFFLIKKNFFFLIIFLILFLKNDSKNILNFIFMFSVYLFFIFKDYKKTFYSALVIFIYLVIDTFLILISPMTENLLEFSKSFKGEDILRFGGQIIADPKNTLEICGMDNSNSINNHFCSIKDNPTYMFELYLKRFFFTFFWINKDFSIQYQILSGFMILVYYSFFILAFLKLRNKFENFYFFSICFLLPFIIIIPFIIDGNQRYITHAYVFLTPIVINSLAIFYKKFF